MRFIVSENNNRTFISEVDPARKLEVMRFVEDEHFIISDTYKYLGDDSRTYCRVDVYGVITKQMQMQLKLAFG